jgi:hypothetical protein
MGFLQSDNKSKAEIISVKIGASWSAADFKISDGIESGPVALCMFCFFSSLVTPLQLIFMSDIVWYGLFPLFGQLFRFSFGNTDWNCSFNISANQRQTN